MVSGTVSHWESLQEWSPSLFLVAGAILVVYAALYGLEAATGAANPRVQDVLLPLGYITGVVGLLGLYPTFTGRAPTLARAAIVVAVGPLVGWGVLLALSIGEIAGGLPPGSDLLPGAFFLAHPVTMILTYGLFAVAALRSDFHSRTVGLLLLAPPTLLVALMVGSAIRPGDFPFGAFVISSGQAMAHLAIGYTLQTGSLSSEREEPPSDGNREALLQD